MVYLKGKLNNKWNLSRAILFYFTLRMLTKKASDRISTMELINEHLITIHVKVKV